MWERLKNIPREAWRDAARFGLQAAVAAVLTLAVLRWLGSSEEFLGILGAVLILQPSVGGTIGTGWARIQATVAGSVLGLLCLLVLPRAWGVTAGLALSMLVVGGLASMRPAWSYGLVAAVGIALAGSEDAAGEAALARMIALAVGAGIGIVVSLIVWPERAEVRFERHLRGALRATATRLTDAVDAAGEPGRDAAPPGHVSDYHKAMGRAQEALDAAKFVDREAMRRRLEALRRLYNSVIILGRAAESESPYVSEAEDLRHELAEVKRDACKVLTALAEGKTPEVGVGELDAVLDRLRKARTQDDPTSELHRSRHVLAFGLWEVRVTLADLIEAQDGTGG